MRLASPLHPLAREIRSKASNISSMKTKKDAKHRILLVRRAKKRSEQKIRRKIKKRKKDRKEGK